MEKLDSIEDTKANTGERGTAPRSYNSFLICSGGSTEQTVFDCRDTLRDKSTSDLDFHPAGASQYLYVSIMLWLEQPHVQWTHEKQWTLLCPFASWGWMAFSFTLLEALGYNCISNVSIRSTTSVSVGSHEESAQLRNRSLEFCGNIWTKCNCPLEDQRHCRIPLHLRQMQHRQIWVHIFLLGKATLIFILFSSFFHPFFIMFWV